MTVTDLSRAISKLADDSGLPTEGVNRALLDVLVATARRAHKLNEPLFGGNAQQRKETKPTT